MASLLSIAFGQEANVIQQRKDSVSVVESSGTVKKEEERKSRSFARQKSRVELLSKRPAEEARVSLATVYCNHASSSALRVSVSGTIPLEAQCATYSAGRRAQPIDRLLSQVVCNGGYISCPETWLDRPIALLICHSLSFSGKATLWFRNWPHLGTNRRELAAWIATQEVSQHAISVTPD